MGRIEQPAVALRFDEWWVGLAPEVELREDADAGVVPTTIVSVDAMRNVASPTAPLAADGRLLFVEVVEAPGVQHFDVSGYLWNCGLSVIDVVRPVIATADGGWEFAVGIARHTPIQVTPPAFAEAHEQAVHG